MLEDIDKNCKRIKMIITEENFRFLVRSILSEGTYGTQKRADLDYSKKWDELDVTSWLSSKVDEIDQVKIGDRYYFSFGFIEQGNVKGLGIKVPKEDLPFIRKKINFGDKIIDKAKPFNIVKPKKGEYTKHADFKDSTILVIPEGAPNVILGTSVLDTGKTTTAEVTTQILDIVGGVPLLGEFADASNVVVQLAMKPPRYFGAFLSVLGAIPTIGTTFAFIKIAKNAGDIKDAVKAGKALNKALLDSVGEESMRSLLKGKSMFSYIVKYKDEVIEQLTKNSDSLGKFIPNIDDVITSFGKYLDKFADAYKAYSALPPIKFKKEIAAWQTFVLRGEAKAAEGFYREFRKEFQAGLEQHFNIKIPYPEEDDINKALTQLIEKSDSGGFEDLTEQQAKFAYKLGRRLKSDLAKYAPAEAKKIAKYVV